MDRGRNLGTYKIIIKSMTVFDITEVIRIQNENNLSSWSVDDYTNQIKNVHAVNLLAISESNQETVGFLIARLIINKVISNELRQKELCARNELEIYNIAVGEKFQNIGIGTALLKSLYEGSCSKLIGVIWLEVREANKKAINFYKKQGFVQAYKRKNYYTNPADDALVMKLELNNN